MNDIKCLAEYSNSKVGTSKVLAYSKRQIESFHKSI